MSKKTQERLSKNQARILEILAKYHELTARDIAEILWARNISYKTPEYSSVHRSLTSLCRRGFVAKVGGQLKWRKTEGKLTHTSKAKKCANISNDKSGV